MADQVLESLMRKLEISVLTSELASEALTECFVLTHREFVKARQSSLTVEEADARCRALVEEEFQAQDIAPAHARRFHLRLIDERLRDFFGFASMPELERQHDTIMRQIIGKMSTQ